MKKIRDDPDRGMYCIDWNDDDPIEMIGNETDDDYARLEVVFAPCNYLHTIYDHTEDSVSPECIADLNE